MILLLPGNANRLMQAIRPNPEQYGWLLTPRRTMTRSNRHGLRYAVDNECFTLGDRFDPDRYQDALIRIAAHHGTADCLFATAPDVVGDAAATLRKFAKWSQLIRSFGLPVALVGQDGLEDYYVPWDDLDCLFIGGSTEWKLGSVAASLINEAKEMGKWTHFGRINSVKKAHSLKAKPHSVDGTAWAKHPAHYAREWQTWLDWQTYQLALLSTPV